MDKIIIAYVPVLHEGYYRFFEKHKDAKLYILGEDLIAESDYLQKEIRALEPGLAQKAIGSWRLLPSVFVLEKNDIDDVAREAEAIIMPDEDLMHELEKKYFPGKKVVYDEIFLRWDKHNTTKEFPISPDIRVSKDEFDRQIILKASEQAGKSSDWWRRVGSVIVKDGEILISTYNQHVPSPHMPSVSGDPRSCFHKGVHLELSTAIHAEAAAISQAARMGTSLEGASIYVTHFPCPPCAKLIAYSGIKKLYYTIGYGVLDGESILKQNGVEIIFVDVDLPEDKSDGTVEYKKK
jgi:dCMP deaminase